MEREGIGGRKAGSKRSTELDVDAFETCLDDPKAMGQVRYDIGLGNKADLSGTPTFFANGYSVVGAFPPPVLDEIMKQILEHDPE